MNRLFVAVVLLIVLVAILSFIYIFKKKIGNQNDKLKRIFDNMQEGFALHEIICDSNGKPVDYKFIDVNKSFESITGLKGHEIKNRTVKEILPGTEKYWIEKYGEVALTGEPTSFTEYSKEVGKHFSVSVYSPQKMKFITIFTDVTQLKEEKTLFQTILRSLGDGVITIDKNGKIDIMNTVAEKLTGWTNIEAKGVEFNEVFKIINEFTREKCESSVRQVFETGEIIELGNNTILIKKNGEELPIEDSVAPIKDEKANINGVVIVFRDFAEKKEKQEKIIYLSYHDQLTGLYNRRFFEEELRRLDIDRNLPFTIAMLDVNGLKLINDAFGHFAGDKLLKKIAEILKREFRSDDIIARVGGDEFVILLPKTTNEETEKIIKRMYKAVEKEELESIVISASIGCDTKISSEQLMRDIYIKAEENMYRKKITESQVMRNKTIQVILKNLIKKNPMEKIHSEKVSLISRRIGEAMNLDYETLKEIEISALLHDIGKIVINENLLNKPGELTELEYEEIKRHPEGSYQILKSLNEYSSLAEYVLSHHERSDGKGYPRGLAGEKIPLISRIISVAESFEDMTSDRPYRKAMLREEAIDELKKHSGTQFDSNIVKIVEEKLL